MNPTTTNLWHGYSLDDIEHLAGTAARQARGGRLLDPTDRHEAAWGAIVEALATADTPPTTSDLLTVAYSAVNRASQDHRHTWGMTRAWGSTDGDMAAYQRYWELARRSVASPEDPVVDRTALAQIWPRLSATHQQVLYALALHDGDHHAAAATAGKTLITFRSHLKSARAAYRALWHEHETPSRMWGKSGQQGRRTAAQTLANRRQQRARRAAAQAA
jgi:DNA-directed RNA polymerase specialized sigma24 family protein